MTHQILTYNQIDRTEWSGLVQSSSTGTWFQTPEAYDFFVSMPELFRPFVLAISCQPSAVSRQALRGVCVGYVTVEKNPIKQFFTRRSIIIGGPALADDCTEDEVEALMKAAREMLQSQAIYVETRNFNDYSRWKGAFENAGFEYQAHLNFHVDTSSVEVVEKNIHKSRKRDIKTSLRDGAVIIEKPSLVQVREFYQILSQLYKTRVKTPLFPFPFFEKLWNQPYAHFLLVGKKNEQDKMCIIGGTINVGMDIKCLYEWFACGRDGEWRTIFPSSVATYAGIRYAAEHDMPRFDMMGAGVPEETYGVRDFKAKFGGKIVEHGRYIHIVKPLLFQLGKIGVKLLKKLK